MSVEKIEFQCQGAVLEPVHARLLRACTPQNISRFEFSSDLVCTNIGWTSSVEKIEFQCQGAALEPVHAKLLRACTLQKF